MTKQIYIVKDNGNGKGIKAFDTEESAKSFASNFIATSTSWAEIIGGGGDSSIFSRSPSLSIVSCPMEEHGEVYVLFYVREGKETLSEIGKTEDAFDKTFNGPDYENITPRSPYLRYWRDINSDICYYVESLRMY